MKTSSTLCVLFGTAVAAFALTPALAGQPLRLPAADAPHRSVCADGAQPGTVRCTARVVTDAAGNPLVSNATTISGYRPADLLSAYQVPSNPTFTSASIPVIALVDAYDYPNAFNDLNTYRAQFGLPALVACAANSTTAGSPPVPCFAKLNQSGSSTGLPSVDTSGWSQEAALDIEMASAMCPACTIVLVEAKSTSTADLGTAANTAAGFANAVSNSYSGGETGTSSYAGYYNHANVAITASSGDSGYAKGVVGFPASYTNVVAVGGTSLKTASNARGWTETVWNTSATEGTVSGCSTVYGAPSGQSAVLPNSTACTKRVVADISAVADPATGVAVYGPATVGRKGPGASGWLVFGGTSVASPLVAGMYGLAYGINGSLPANAPAALYATFKSSPSSFNDVTSGTDGNPTRASCGAAGSSTYYLCNAQAGFDAPTGLGTPAGLAAF